MNFDCIHKPNWRQLTWLVCLVVLDTCRPAVNETPVADFGCYAFIRNGALVLRCSGEVETPDLDLKGFAVSADGNYLGLKRSHGVRLDEFRVNRINDSKLVMLRTKTVQETQFYPELLLSSCGKFIGFEESKGMLDLITGMALSKPPYAVFRCSKNETVVVGYTDEKNGSYVGRTLLSGFPPTVVSKFNDYPAFDVSPNGEYIAFTATNGRDAVVDRLCVIRNRQSPECAEGLSIAGRGVSVSDAGQVLFEQYTAQECVYKDEWHFFPSSGKGEEGRDGCAGVFRWQVGVRDPELLESLGRDPQWIPNASLLKRWMRDAVKF